MGEDQYDTVVREAGEETNHALMVPTQLGLLSNNPSASPLEPMSYINVVTGGHTHRAYVARTNDFLNEEDLKGAVQIMRKAPAWTSGYRETNGMALVEVSQLIGDGDGAINITDSNRADNTAAANEKVVPKTVRATVGYTFSYWRQWAEPQKVGPWQSLPLRRVFRDSLVKHLTDFQWAVKQISDGVVLVRHD